jgi:hypothetical protein
MTLMHSRRPAAFSLTCLPYHLDEHFSGLRRLPYFSQEGDSRSMHDILNFEADVKAEAIDRGHLRLLRFNTNKPFGEQDECILMVGIHLDEAARSWDWLKKTGSNTQGKVRSEPRVYLTGREPVIRISTSLLALCCQSGLDATWETPIRARSRSNGSRSLRMSPLLIARFTKPSIAP